MTNVGYSHDIVIRPTMTLIKTVVLALQLSSWVRHMDTLRHENIPVRIALSLRQQAEEIARHQNTSLNHWVTQALEEKILRMGEHNKILHRMHDRSQQLMPESLQSAG